MCDDKMSSCGTSQGGCGCGGNKGCGNGWGHRSLLRFLLALAVLIIVFCMGFKLGVLCGYLGWGDHQGGRMMYKYDRGMMQQGWDLDASGGKTMMTTTQR